MNQISRAVIRNRDVYNQMDAVFSIWWYQVTTSINHRSEVSQHTQSDTKSDRAVRCLMR
jgi:hypothetical protein